MDPVLENHSIVSEAQIIEKIITGEIALFEVLIRRNNPLLYKIGRSYGFDHQDAQDLMQETYISAYQNLRQFSFKSTFRTWLSRIMINKCLYRINHSYKKHEMAAGEYITENTKPLFNTSHIAPDSASIKKEFNSILEKAIEKLPLNYRSVFVLREIEAFSIAETSELLNITPVNVKVRLNRAKTLLQKELEQFYKSSSLYEFNLIYCDKMVEEVYKKIGVAGSK